MPPAVFANPPSGEQIYQNALTAIAELERQVDAIRNAPYDPENDWSPYAEERERMNAIRAVEHVIGLHDGTEPGLRGPRSRRDMFCRLCQAFNPIVLTSEPA